MRRHPVRVKHMQCGFFLRDGLVLVCRGRVGVRGEQPPRFERLAEKVVIRTGILKNAVQDISLSLVKLLTNGGGDDARILERIVHDSDRFLKQA